MSYFIVYDFNINAKFFHYNSEYILFPSIYMSIIFATISNFFGIFIYRYTIQYWF